MSATGSMPVLRENELRTERLLLVSPVPEASDVAFREMMNNRENLQHLKFFWKDWTLKDVVNRREAQWRDQEKGLAFNCVIYSIEHCTERETERDVMVGIGGFREINLEKKNGEFGIILDHKAWGKAISTEAHIAFLDHAFSALGLTNAYARTQDANKPMIRFFKKYGIQHTGNVELYEQAWRVYEIERDAWPEIRAKMLAQLRK